jgi:ribosomal-protein-alanine N-acetyltransferase
MSFIFTPVDKATVRAFLEWRYEPPYDIYDLDPDEAQEIVRYFVDPEVNCFGVRDEAGSLVAYCTFGLDGQVPGGDYGAEALDIGLGVRPDLTGRGQGLIYVNAVVAFARHTFAPTALRVTIAEFNRRAQRVWEKAGFQRRQRFERAQDGFPFLVLVWEG